jgi:predicted RNase H-like HicB family nuclease
MAHGDTREEAREKAGDAIKAWIATAAEFGYRIPQPVYRT